MLWKCIVTTAFTEGSALFLHGDPMTLLQQRIIHPWPHVVLVNKRQEGNWLQTQESITILCAIIKWNRWSFCGCPQRLMHFSFNTAAELLLPNNCNWRSRRFFFPITCQKKEGSLLFIDILHYLSNASSSWIQDFYLRFMYLINVEAMYLHRLHTSMFSPRNHFDRAASWLLTKALSVHK